MLTIIQPKNDPSTQEGSQRLGQSVDGQLDPRLTCQEAHGKKPRLQAHEGLPAF